MTILLLGDAADAHIDALAQKLRSRGRIPFVFSTGQALERLHLSFSPTDSEAGFIKSLPDGPSIRLADISAGFWRMFEGVRLGNRKLLPEQMGFIRMEYESAFKNMLYCLNIAWVNTPAAIDQHLLKIHQLQIIQAAGARVPRAWITNDAEESKALFEREGGRLIAKPICAGYYTRRLTPENTAPAKLAGLDIFLPTHVQAYIPGVDLMVYRVGDRLFAAQVETRAETDFRNDPDARFIPITLPDDVAETCLRVADALGQRWSLIDVRRTPDGEHVFIEANPSPKFLAFEAKTGYPLTDSLADLMVSLADGAKQ